jgi:hypothetical protein
MENLNITTIDEQSKNTLETETKRLYSETVAFTISNSDELEQSAKFLSKIKSNYKTLEASRVSIKEPALKECRDIDDFFKPFLERLTKAEKVLKDAVKKYTIEQEKKMNEARIAAQIEAKKREDEIKSKLQAHAESEKSAGNLEKAKFIESVVNSTEISPAVIAEQPTIKGISTRKVWKFNIVDASKLPFHFLIPNESVIRAFVEKTRGTVRVDGLEIYEDTVIASR